MAAAAAVVTSATRCPFYRLSLRAQGRTQAVRCHIGALRKANLQVGTKSDGVPLRDTIQILEEEIQEGVREIRGLMEQLAALEELEPEQGEERVRIDSDFKAVLAEYHRQSRGGVYPVIPRGSGYHHTHSSGAISPTGIQVPSGELRDIASVHGTGDAPPRPPPLSIIPGFTIQGENSPVPRPLVTSHTHLAPPTPRQSRRKRRRSQRLALERSYSSTRGGDTDRDSDTSSASDTSLLGAGDKMFLLPPPPAADDVSVFFSSHAGQELTDESLTSIAEAEKKASLRLFCGLIVAAVLMASSLGIIVLFLDDRWKT